MIFTVSCWTRFLGLSKLTIVSIPNSKQISALYLVCTHSHTSKHSRDVEDMHLTSWLLYFDIHVTLLGYVPTFCILGCGMSSTSGLCLDFWLGKELHCSEAITVWLNTFNWFPSQTYSYSHSPKHTLWLYVCSLRPDSNSSVWSAKLTSLLLHVILRSKWIGNIVSLVGDRL